MKTQIIIIEILSITDDVHIRLFLYVHNRSYVLLLVSVSTQIGTVNHKLDKRIVCLDPVYPGKKKTVKWQLRRTMF